MKFVIKKHIVNDRNEKIVLDNTILYVPDGSRLTIGVDESVKIVRIDKETSKEFVSITMDHTNLQGTTVYGLTKTGMVYKVDLETGWGGAVGHMLMVPQED